MNSLKMFETTKLLLEKCSGNSKQFNAAYVELADFEARFNVLKSKVSELESKKDDYECLLKSDGERLIFKISANVEEITKMVSVEEGGEYTIFVSDAFKTNAYQQEELSKISKDVLNVLLNPLLNLAIE